MAQLEKWFEHFKSIDELTRLRETFEISKDHALSIYFQEDIKAMVGIMMKESLPEVMKDSEVKDHPEMKDSKKIDADAVFSEKESALLLKAINMFPGGTVDRWTRITDYVNAHAKGTTTFTNAQIIKASNQIKNDVLGSRPAVAPEQAVEWSVEEQSKLENALKSFPVSDPERWDKIAAAIGTRSKKECVARFKEIALAIKAAKESK